MPISDWILFTLTALLIGIGKTGFSGLSLLPVSIFASYFGKESIGILLPLLVVADLTVYPAMRKHGSWREVYPLLLPALIGIGLGLYLLKIMPNDWARPVIGTIIIVMLLVMLWKSLRPESPIYQSRGFGIFSAISGGVATTLANAAGPVIKIYLLTQKFDKMALVGISARFFLLINLIKLPLLGGISYITRESLWFNLQLAPLVMVGVFIGKWLLTKVPQQLFDKLVVAFAILAAIRLFV